MTVGRFFRLAVPLVCAAVIAGCAAHAPVSRTTFASPITPAHLLSLPPAYPAGLPPGTPYASVHVRCTITVAGAAEGCISLTALTNPVARDTALRWLADPATRFQPARRDAILIPAIHEMHIGFFYNTKNTPAYVSSVLEWPHPRPEFPDTYAETRRSGVVTYHFTVGPDGLPKDVLLDTVTGGPAFGESVLFWLRSGSVHYRPNFSQGVPVATLFPVQTLSFKIGN